MTTETYNFVPLIVKKILSGLVPALSAPAVDKTQYLVYLRFNSTLQLINGTLNNPPKMLKYFNSTAIIAFFRIIDLELAEQVFSL